MFTGLVPLYDERYGLARPEYAPCSTAPAVRLHGAGHIGGARDQCGGHPAPARERIGRRGEATAEPQPQPGGGGVALVPPRRSRRFEPRKGDRGRGSFRPRVLRAENGGPRLSSSPRRGDRRGAAAQCHYRDRQRRQADRLLAPVANSEHRCRRPRLLSSIERRSAPRNLYQPAGTKSRDGRVDDLSGPPGQWPPWRVPGDHPRRDRDPVLRRFLSCHLDRRRHHHRHAAIGWCDAGALSADRRDRTTSCRAASRERCESSAPSMDRCA